MRERLRPWLVPLLGAAASLAAYVSTLAPTVTGEDSGELAAAAATLGVAHPPGYPLWTLLGHAFSWLPCGDVAWRLNLLSALLGAAAVAGACRLLLRLGVRPALALAGALLVASGPALWSQSVITEVYTLNLALFVAWLHLVLTWRDAGEGRALMAACFVTGLGLGNHHTFLLLLPPLAWLVLLDRRRPGWARALPALAGAIAAGLSVYLYLPLASLGNPALDWGDPESWANFLDHVARRQYPSQLGTGVSFLWAACWLGEFARQAAAQVPLWPLGLALAWPGAVFLRRRLAGAWRPALLLATLLGPVLVLLLGYPMDPEYRSACRVFFLPFHLLLALAVVSGVESVLARWEVGPRAGLARVGAPAAFLSVVLLFGATTMQTETMAGNDVARRQAENLLHSLERGSVLFAEADHEFFPLLYLQVVEQVRPDVLVCDFVGPFAPQVGGLGYDAARVDPAQAARDWSRFIARTRRPVYFTRKREVAAPGRMVPEGLAFRWLPDGAPAPKGLAIRRAWRHVDRPQAGPWLGTDRTTRALDSGMAQFQGLELFRRGRREAALREIDWAGRQAFDVRQACNNLGSLLAEAGEVPRALACYHRALDIDPAYGQARSNVETLRQSLGDSFPPAWTLAELLLTAPHDPAVHHDLGTWHARRGEMRQARGEYRQALALRPDYALAWKHLAAVCRSLPGRQIEAEKASRHYAALAGETGP